MARAIHSRRLQWQRGNFLRFGNATLIISAAVVLLVRRLVPAVRTLISVPAGVAGMALAPILLYSSIGTVAWTTVLALGGRALESRHAEIAD